MSNGHHVMWKWAKEAYLASNKLHICRINNTSITKTLYLQKSRLTNKLTIYCKLEFKIQNY